MNLGGGRRNRTHIKGFGDLCSAIEPFPQRLAYYKNGLLGKQDKNRRQLSVSRYFAY